MSKSKVKNTEFYIYMDNPPVYDHSKPFYSQTKEVLDFYEDEYLKITEGFYIDGVFIHPWLYWHVNYFQTPIPTKVEGTLKKTIEEIRNPPLDDNFLYFLENYERCSKEQRGLVIFGCRGFGKALSNDELIYLKDGITKPIGNCKVNDEIYGPDGKLTKVLGVYPQGDIQMYEVTLRDGRKIECCDEHLWEVYDYQGGTRKTLPLKEIKKRYKFNRKYCGSKYKDGKDRITEVYNYFLPTNNCLEYDEKELPLDPYILGIYLGDGHRNSTTITSVDEEILKSIEDYAQKNGLDTNRQPKYQRISIIKGKNKVNTYRNLLRDLNVYEFKKIPEIYLRSSKEQRLELVRGLFDSDGTISKEHQISFTQTCPILFDQVETLCRSLGMVVKCKRDFETNYIKKDNTVAISNSMVIHTDEKVFRLSRKLNRQISTNKNNKFTRTMTSIVDIKKTEVKPATCIRVANEDKLFLTTNFIVTHNTQNITSNSSWINTINSNGTYEVIGGSKDDLESISRLMDIAFNNVNPAFKLPRNISDWTKHVEFGIKTKSGERVRHSDIFIKNANKGQKGNSEKGAGGSPIGAVLDEIGKWSPIDLVKSLLPALQTQFGLKAIAILSGTGGSVSLSKDAKKILKNPNAYSLIEMDYEVLNKRVPEELRTWDSKKRFGVFVPAQMSYRLPYGGKKETNLADYWGVNSNYLKKVKVQVTDWEKSLEFIKNRRASLKSDDEALNSEKMYFPIDTPECFLESAKNPFPVRAANRKLEELENSGDIGQAVELHRGGDWLTKEFSDKKRAEDPHPGGEADAPVIIYNNHKFPDKRPPENMYVSGMDGYKTDISETDSVGAFYVLKRRNLELNEPCERIVASYAARPPRMIDFHKQNEILCEGYNAPCCMESVDTGFIQHMDLKGKAHALLTPAISFSEAAQKRPSRGNSRFGIYPTKQNQTYMFNLFLDYCKEPHVVDINEEGEEIIKLGVEFIDDPDLLREIIRYKPGGNHDRIIAFMHALTWCRELDKKGFRPIIENKGKINKKNKSGYGRYGRTRSNPY